MNFQPVNSRVASTWVLVESVSLIEIALPVDYMSQYAFFSISNVE